jgi:hypothetical protein
MKFFLKVCAAFLASISITLAEDNPDPVFAEWRNRVDPAVENALRHLASAQREDGSFPDRFGDSTGIPALVGMAFLSKGYLPTEEPHSDTLNRCIDFILDNQTDQGLFEKGNAGSGPMYAHNIATLFLSEVSGIVDTSRQKRIDIALPKALALLLRAQAVPKDKMNQGGWRYGPKSDDSDTSCSGWALMALRSAKLNGAAIPASAIQDATAYLKRHQDPKLGSFGYQDTRTRSTTLTGMGLLCLELSGEHGSENSLKAAKYVMENLDKLPGQHHELYGNYYNAQGLFQVGGEYWRNYATWMYSNYLPKQELDGSWNSADAGRIYGTAIMVLAFTVPYRQLPIYQRDETVGESETKLSP